MESPNDVSSSRIYKLERDTKFLHLIKQSVYHIQLQFWIIIARLKHVSFFWHGDSNDSFTFKFNNTTHQSQTNTKEPTFIKVSSMMNSLIFLLLEDIFCWCLYFWIHQFQIDTWFLLIKCKDSIWEAFLNDKPQK